jgi:hypothetical protein
MLASEADLMPDSKQLPDGWHVSRSQSFSFRYYKLYTCSELGTSFGAGTNPACVLLLRTGWYVVSFMGKMQPEHDVGPFGCVEDAMVAALLRRKF